MRKENKHTVSLGSVSLDDIASVGGKNASLGEMMQGLTNVESIHIPAGFAVTTTAFLAFLDHNHLKDKIAATLEGLDTTDLKHFQKTCKTIRDDILGGEFPQGIQTSIKDNYNALKAEYKGSFSLAVRSSATAEDLPTMSFAGLHDTFLFIHSFDELLVAIKKCYASLYNDRAISYRNDNKVDHMDVALSVGVQKMVNASDASSGVIFTLDPETGARSSILISAAYGIGEAIVQGIVEPDSYTVHKELFLEGYRQVYKHKLGSKHQKYIAAKSKPLKLIATPAKQQGDYCLRDDEILSLADAACAIEAHYSARHGKPTPMDIEWAKEGETGALFIVQARPETAHSQKSAQHVTRYILGAKAKPIVTGSAIGQKITSGTVRYISHISKIDQFDTGDILVTETTSPDWEPLMKKAGAIVTDHGGRTCHSAIVAREIGIPAIVGCGDATKLLKDDMQVTISCAQGETGRVYDGALPFEVKTIDIGSLKQPKTKIMLNLSDPDQALQISRLPSAGSGLVRIEFIIANQIRVHPMALKFPEKVLDKKTAKQIADLTQHYDSGEDYFCRRLAEGMASIAAGFYPRPVIIRTSDFKSNEYFNLLGGHYFEEKESNPMIGFRGASRYIHPRYSPAFELECKAIKLARETMGFSNIKVMIPFCRSVTEAEKVIQIMEQNNLSRGEAGLEVYMMCEIPSNVLSIDAFSNHFDGFSIGSNDLTQLTLGVDRDSALLASTFNERDPAVLRAITMAIEGAHRNGKPIGICGQAPSDYPDFTRFLVDEGIDSISVIADSFFDMLKIAQDVEKDSKG